MLLSKQIPNLCILVLLNIKSGFSVYDISLTSPLLCIVYRETQLLGEQI